MIIDVDSISESVLGDVLAKYGDTPLIARTASKGGFHVYFGENSSAWRYHKNSRRVIRPEDKPVDYLGTGFAVVPPSTMPNGVYEFIRGNLDDIDRLPPFRGLVPARQDAERRVAKEPPQTISEGKRNNSLFYDCMRRGRSCANFDQLLAFARDINLYYRPPMDDAEVIKVANSAWRYTEQGKNRFGQHGVWCPIEEVTNLLHDQDALILLTFLRAHNGPHRQFMIANGLTETFDWTSDS
jgi:hypothetical protein